MIDLWLVGGLSMGTSHCFSMHAVNNKLAMAQWRNSCCNPFDKVHHNVRNKAQLRTVTKAMCKKFPLRILPGEMICHTCRKQAMIESEYIPDLESIEEHLPATNNSSDSDIPEASTSPVKKYQASVATESRATINELLTSFGQTPLTKRKLQNKCEE